jgi:hypothetical protein
MMHKCGRTLAIVFGVVGAGAFTPVGAQDSLVAVDSLSARALRAPAFADSTTALHTDSLSGKSGKLWMRLLSETRQAGVALFRRFFGDSTVSRAGIYTTRDSLTGRPFSFVKLVPFDEKEKGRVGSYRMGLWPGERRAPRSGAYVNPDGFIEVTPETEETPVSEHFRLKDFLTHDQRPVWPKYLVLSEALVDKLELTITALQRRGIHAERLAILSGFRTPQYNAKGVRRGGRARDSRHQFGDAADVFVDSNGDGRMDDLNRDGRVNSRDARLLAQAVESVERENADLVGGLAIYPATRAHGPFVHVDVRGVKARWGRR